MKIAAFTGKKYSGKDTAANALPGTRKAFADELRAMLYDLDPIVATDSYGRVFRWREVYDDEGYDTLKKLPEARRLMQVMGTEVIRARFPDFWVDLLEKQMLLAPEKDYTITDVRFDNEAKMVRKHGGQVIEIVYTGQQDRDTHGADHVSEQGISPGLIDAKVYNPGDDLEEFHYRVRAAVETLER